MMNNLYLLSFLCIALTTIYLAECSRQRFTMMQLEPLNNAIRTFQQFYYMCQHADSRLVSQQNYAFYSAQNMQKDERKYCLFINVLYKKLGNNKTLSKHECTTLEYHIHLNLCALYLKQNDLEGYNRED